MGESELKRMHRPAHFTEHETIHQRIRRVRE
jgi:hypothetical protein